jgi:hypothetical protein
VRAHLVLLAVSASLLPPTATAADPSPTAASPGRATDVVATLAVKGRAPKTGYSREQFGAAWSDVDHNVLAVDGPTDARKGDGDAATWLPPRKSYRCAYAARQIAVKATYGLWVTRAERDAMARVLDRCPGQRVPT